jgi:heme exporter protein C
MKGLWWKITGAVLVLYMIIGGMYFPLSTGILKVEPISLKTGNEFQLSISAYNTSFTQSGNIDIWLYDTLGHVFKMQSPEVISDNFLIASGILPAKFKDNIRTRPLNLLVAHEKHGFSVFPNAVFVSYDSTGTTQSEWNPSIPNHQPAGHITFPFRNILEETIRNTYFHVTLWFALMFIMLGSAIQSTRYLMSSVLKLDNSASALAQVGFLFGILGLLTGALWAKHTWGAYWSWDIKQNMTAIALLIYGAYFILREAVESKPDRARLSAVYNIFAFVMLIPLLYIIPRMADSLHPGAGGNPGLGGEDLDNNMRMFFYPGIIGMTLIGYWIAQLCARYLQLKDKLDAQVFNRINDDNSNQVK